MGIDNDIVTTIRYDTIDIRYCTFNVQYRIGKARL